MIKPEVEITIRLPRKLADDVEKTAQEYDLTIGAVVREALTSFIQRKQRQNGAECEGGERSDCVKGSSSMHESLKPLMAEAVKESKNWDELQELLSLNGLEIAPKGGGLVLRSVDSKHEICKASDLDFPYRRLIKNYKCGFPGHSHQWLVDKVLGKSREKGAEE